MKISFNARMGAKCFEDRLAKLVAEVCRHGLRPFGVVMSGVFDDRERRQEVSEHIVHVEFRRRLPGTVSRPVNAVGHIHRGLTLLGQAVYKPMEKFLTDCGNHRFKGWH